MLDIFFHAESWWKLALKDLPRRPCCFLEILSSLSDLAIPGACVGGCDSCVMVPNGKFQKPNLCQLSLWNAIMQCKFPPTFFVFRNCSPLSRCRISKNSGFWVFRSVTISAHLLQWIAGCFLLDSPIKIQYSTSCDERGPLLNALLALTGVASKPIGQK